MEARLSSIKDGILMRRYEYDENRKGRPICFSIIRAVDIYLINVASSNTVQEHGCRFPRVNFKTKQMYIWEMLVYDQ